MMHANLVRSQWDDNGGELIDLTVRLADQQMSDVLRDEGSPISGFRGLGGVIASFLLGLAALAVAAVFGLYVSDHVQVALDQASAWILSLRRPS